MYGKVSCRRLREREAMHTRKQTEDLVQKFLARGYQGIAAFLRILQLLDEEQQEDLFAAFVVHIRAQTTITDPILFFESLGDVLSDALPPAIAKEASDLDTVCTGFAQVWEALGHKVQ